MSSDPSKKKKIAIVGMGAIGSTFAFEFANLGHSVTVVARNKRFELLQKEMSLTRANEKKGTVKLDSVLQQLDSEIEYDYVLVCVMAHQVDSLLPQLKASKAKEIGFFYNTFDNYDKLIEAVGKERFTAGFPSITARLEPDNSVFYEFQKSGMVNTMNEKRWEKFFKENGIPAAYESDMLSWARTHVAFACGFLTATALAYNRSPKDGTITSEEARILAAAIKEGFGIVQKLGQKVIPFSIKMAGKSPLFMLTSIVSGGAKSGRHFGVLGFNEPKTLWNTVKQTYGSATPCIDAALQLIDKGESEKGRGAVSDVVPASETPKTQENGKTE